MRFLGVWTCLDPNLAPGLLLAVPGLSRSTTVAERFPTFLMLRPFNTVPHVVVTPSHKMAFIASLQHNFATVMNHNENIIFSDGLR